MKVGFACANALHLLFLAQFFCAASAQYSAWRGANAGEDAMCAEGEVLVGLCSSGGNPDCKVGGTYYYAAIRCATVPTPDFKWHNNEYLDWISAPVFGHYNRCPAGSMAVGRCASGKYWDCGGAPTKLRCAKAPATDKVYVNVEPSDHGDPLCGNVGNFKQCPPGYVVIWECGSGANADCNKDICSDFGPVYTGIRCARLKGYQYKGVKEPTIRKPAEYEVEDCRKDSFAHQGSEPSKEIITNTVEVTASKTESFTSSQTSGGSLSNRFKVSVNIAQEYGLPKVGSGTASIGTEFERTWATEFSNSQTYIKDLTDQKKRTISIQKEFVYDYGSWIYITWGGKARGFGTYTTEFHERSPGLPASVVPEPADITTEFVSPDTYLIILNAACYDADLFFTNCYVVAKQFMEGTGYFANFTRESLLESISSVEDCGGGGVPPPKQLFGRRRLLASGTQLHQGDETYDRYLEACGEYDYEVFLHVDSSPHLLAIGYPKEASALAAGCPSGATHAVISQDQNTNPYKELLFWDDKEVFQSLFNKEDSLSIGTIKLLDLARAFELADPSTTHAIGYDLITNNCGSYLIDLVNKLEVEVDYSHVAAFVTRRLLKHAGKELAASIRNSVNRFTLSQNSPNNNENRMLRREATDEALVELLVNDGMSKLW